MNDDNFNETADELFVDDAEGDPVPVTYLDKDGILNADDLVLKDVPVPEWGGTVKLRMLSGAERDAFEVSCLTGRGKEREVNLRNLRAKLAALSIVEPTPPHKRMFGENEVKQLSRKSAKALQRVFEAAQTLNGMTDEVVEELLGNSEQTQDDGSGLDWRSLSDEQLVNSNAR